MKIFKTLVYTIIRPLKESNVSSVKKFSNGSSSNSIQTFSLVNAFFGILLYTYIYMYVYIHRLRVHRLSLENIIIANDIFFFSQTLCIKLLQNLIIMFATRFVEDEKKTKKYTSETWTKKKMKDKIRCLPYTLANTRRKRKYSTSKLITNATRGVHRSSHNRNNNVLELLLRHVYT